MNDNNDTLVYQKNPLRYFLFGAIIFVVLLILRLFLWFILWLPLPLQVYDIFVSLYVLALSILFIVYYRRKMKYAWYIVFLYFFLPYLIYLYRAITAGIAPCIGTIIWIGIMFVILYLRKKYFKYLEQEPTLI